MNLNKTNVTYSPVVNQTNRLIPALTASLGSRRKATYGRNYFMLYKSHYEHWRNIPNKPI